MVYMGATVHLRVSSSSKGDYSRSSTTVSAVNSVETEEGGNHGLARVKFKGIGHSGGWLYFNGAILRYPQLLYPSVFRC